MEEGGGGMKRVVFGSYGWETQMYAREKVVRMKTVVLERMSSVDRFPLSRSRSDACLSGQVGKVQTRGIAQTIGEGHGQISDMASNKL